MEVIEINCNGKNFIIKRDVVIHVLLKITGKDFSSKSDKLILEAMENNCLIDEMTLESMQAI